ncbi:MAG: M20/M25/M40 family metallo-hydrolase [Thaumarchaeota archaeon]|nr:M20/M25/M40 family metallo-hydrolase [Nitrososphaerota archaeon]
MWDQVLGIIDKDRQDLLDLCLLLGGIRSPRGKEKQVAQAVVDWLTTNGIEARLQPITEESANALGIIPGTGDGTSLICDAHIDTGSGGPVGHTEMAKRFEKGFVDGEFIYGYGIINCKAQVSAFMIAARALLKAGVHLKGDVTIAAVASETGGASVDEFQGVDYPGEGFGSRWLIDRGIVADYALIGETSGFGIITAECGRAELKIQVPGRKVYTPRLERGKSWQENPNAFVKAAHVALALEQWATDYEKREQIEFHGGVIIPKAQIEGIRGDGHSGISGRNCNIYIDVWLAPGANPRSIQQEIQRLIKSLGIDCKVTLYQWNRGFIAQNAETLINAVGEAHRYIHGADPPQPPSSELSMWRDLNAFNEVGIPSICYGAPRLYEPYTDARDRAMKISDLVSATKTYALTMMSICGVDKT